jgi:hypothetical protein
MNKTMKTIKLKLLLLVLASAFSLARPGQPYAARHARADDEVAGSD